MAWMIAPSQRALLPHSVDASEIRQYCRRFLLNFSCSCFETNCTYSESLKTIAMLRCAMYLNVNIIFINFDKHSFDIGPIIYNVSYMYIVTLVWPPKGLRNLIVARGRKRLCTTVLKQINSAAPGGVCTRL